MRTREILFGLATALLLALVLSPFASPWPDGLEKIASDKGFLQKGEGKTVLPAPLSDYTWPGIKSARLSTRIAGVIGTLTVFMVAWGAAALLKGKHDGARHVAQSWFHRR